ncbi:MAG: plastocyanin/azurin family copper-binding protein [SAR202 cluster bacterium]|jgi:plastocyanin|nr:plastocyanin/azurin family copper-binding protein [SAR202 cluster bacterium]
MGESVSITLNGLNASGQVGTATLTAIADTTLVELSLSAGALETELVHIHVGQCGETLADVAHVLANFVGGSGASVTTVDVTLDSLLTGGFAVNAHQSGNPGVYTACGNIPGTGETSVQASVETNIQQFAHVDLTVATGTTVRWTNLDQSTHTVTLGSNGSSAGGFDSGNLRRDAIFEFTFDTAGTVAYTCTIHPSMNATVTVEGAATVATGNPLYSR